MLHLNRKSVLLGLCLLFSAALSAQRIAKVKNVEIEIQQNKALIHYDIKSSSAGSLHSVNLNFIDDYYNIVKPVSLAGDVGSNVVSGSDKTIEWDIKNDFQLLRSKIQPVIFVDGLSKEFNSRGGPTNALLSVIMPGLGDYFVADHRLMHFKPYFRTISSLGLIGLGIYAGNQRYRAEGHYETVWRTSSGSGTPPGFYRDEYVEGDMQYWLLKGTRKYLSPLEQPSGLQM